MRRIALATAALCAIIACGPSDRGEFAPVPSKNEVSYSYLPNRSEIRYAGTR